jgi:hypothetical protein
MTLLEKQKLHRWSWNAAVSVKWLDAIIQTDQLKLLDGKTGEYFNEITPVHINLGDAFIPSTDFVVDRKRVFFLFIVPGKSL